LEDGQIFMAQLKEVDATNYHEAGHAVIDELHGFRPLAIKGPLCVHDRRTSAFLGSRYSWSFLSPIRRERASNYAIGLVAGIAAESKGVGVPFDSLRETSGRGDYEILECLLDRLALGEFRTDSLEARQSQLRLWEAKAKAMLDRPEVWATVESVVSWLGEYGGELGAAEIAIAIREGKDDGRELRRRFLSSHVASCVLDSGNNSFVR
jgi:hypothetical protein